MSSSRDVDDIIATLVRYTTAIDGKYWDLLDEVFTPDAVGVYGDHTYVGRAHIRGYIVNRLQPVGATQHLLGNYVVDVTDTSAMSTCYFRAWHCGAGPQEGNWFEGIGVYRDQLVRTEGGWRIACRDLDLLARAGDVAVLGPVPE